MSNAALAALVDVPRTVWGGGMRPRPLTPAVHPYIEVHHSAATGHYDRDPLVVALEIERYHLSLGWNGPFYGLLVATDGRIIELRGVGWQSIGAHRARYDDDTPVNPAALCVLLPGNYVTQHPTDAQLATLDRLRAAVPDPRLRWHGMRDNTACCGTYAIAACRHLNSRPPTEMIPPLANPEEDPMELLYDTETYQAWIHFGGGSVTPVNPSHVHPFWAAQRGSGATKESVWTGRIVARPDMARLVAERRGAKEEPDA